MPDQPELPGQEPLPPLSEEESGIKSAGYRLVNAQDGAPEFFRFEFANGKEIIVPGPLSDEQQEALMRLTIYAYNAQDGASRLLSDLAAAKQEAHLATHHVGVLGDQLGKAEEGLAAALAALTELVALKDLKEQMGESDLPWEKYQVLDKQYQSRKPAAWSTARALVAPETGEAKP